MCVSVCGCVCVCVCVCVFVCVCINSWLVGWFALQRINPFRVINHRIKSFWSGLILWHINHYRLLNAKYIFIHINSSLSNNSVSHKYTV